jgi:2,3-diketo-5-methylthio-1-phosphopentane phosphatase
MSNDVKNKRLVTDFDGTLTEQDFYELVRSQVLPKDVPDYWKDYFAGSTTHFEALAAYFAAIRSDEDTLLRLADSMGLDEGLSESVALLERHGWGVTVASAGCRWYIDYLLKQAGVILEVYSNPGEFRGDEGLIMKRDRSSPFYSESVGVDKAAIVRDALARFDCVAYAGDGKPDLESALLVEPRYRFARGWLARHLEKEGIAFRGFGRWSEVAGMLVNGEVEA